MSRKTHSDPTPDAIDPTPDPTPEPSPDPAPDPATLFDRALDVLKSGIVAATGAPSQTPELRAFINAAAAIIAEAGHDEVRMTSDPEVPELPPYARPGASESA